MSSHHLVFGIWYFLVFGIWYLVFGIWYRWYLVFGTPNKASLLSKCISSLSFILSHYSFTLFNFQNENELSCVYTHDKSSKYII